MYRFLISFASGDGWKKDSLSVCPLLEKHNILILGHPKIGKST
jgi:hypothetical protein